MKISLFRLAIALLALLFMLQVADAAISHRATGGNVTTTIDEHGVCKKVRNSNSPDIFVPTKTSLEWSKFRSNSPSGVTLGACVRCVMNDQYENPIFFDEGFVCSRIYGCSGYSMNWYSSFKDYTCESNGAWSIGPGYSVPSSQCSNLSLIKDESRPGNYIGCPSYFETPCAYGCYNWCACSTY